MRTPTATTLFALIAIVCSLAVVEASVFLPSSRSVHSSRPATTTSLRKDFSYGPRRRTTSSRRVPITGTLKGTAMAIPGYGVAEQVMVGGFSNFLSIYNLLITGRILLSWIPQAQSVGLLQPIYQVTDPYLNIFRGIIPPVFGLDLSPLLAFFFLSFLGNVTMAVGAEIPEGMREQLEQSHFGQAAARGQMKLMKQPQQLPMSRKRQHKTTNIQPAFAF